MKKILLLLFCLGIFYSFGSTNIQAQGYTPPEWIIGLSLDGNLATNDAHGSALDNQNIQSGTYGMVWGRGATLFAKVGLGVRKNHRITGSIGYNKMVHDGSGEIPFFNFSPKEPYTNYDIITGSVGYEYGFNPRCKNKQFIGFAVTVNNISPKNVGTIPNFESSLRFGLSVSSGYEWTLDKAQSYGIFIGVRYNLLNVLGTKSGVNTMNDASTNPGSNFWRRVGVLSLNIGFNLYTGVKPYRAK